jgi:hypothetical protein
MLVVSALRSVVNESNYTDTAAILWELEKAVLTILNPDKKRGAKDGCDLAVLFIASDGTVSISAGNIDVFVCDGIKVTRHRGQMIHVGEGELQSKDEINVVTIAPDPQSKYYIASDGLYEQIGGDEKIPFGFETFENIILKNHGDKQNAIAERILQAFENYKGEEPQRDDVSLITFQIKTKEGKENV